MQPIETIRVEAARTALIETENEMAAATIRRNQLRDDLDRIDNMIADLVVERDILRPLVDRLDAIHSCDPPEPIICSRCIQEWVAEDVGPDGIAKYHSCGCGRSS